MPRAIWSGAISFGLVNVPVKVYTATSPKDVHFHNVHEKDGARIRQKRFCSAEEKEVPYEEVAKGYEVAPEQYVLIEPKELDALDPEKSRTIDIQEFVELKEIDPLYFERAYYLVPDKTAAKPYALLREAMQNSGRVALAKFVMRTKQYLAAIRATEHALVMETMLFQDEVVPPTAVEGMPTKDVKLNKAEVRLAEQFIEALSASFDPSKYKDDYRERVLELIEKKSRGEKVSVKRVAAPKKTADLMSALEASIAAAKRRQKAATPPRRAARRPAARRPTSAH
jgi:DNA end-binding protein Ku